VDVLTLGPEYFEYISSFLLGDHREAVAAPHSLRLLRGGRFFRLLRLMRLFRLAKLQKLRDTYMDLQQSAEWATLVMKIGFMQFIFLVFMHFAGCMWHAVGFSVTTERTWILDFEERKEREFESVLERYLESLHWAYSQITPSSTAVSPQNTTEVAVTCCIAAISLLVISFFVSRTTVAIGKLNDLRAATESRFDKLRRYLKENQIPRQLALRINAYRNSGLLTPRPLQMKPKWIFFHFSPPSCMAT
jgi:hypothetical protein